jgi:hypothetical protein
LRKASISRSAESFNAVSILLGRGLVNSANQVIRTDAMVPAVRPLSRNLIHKSPRLLEPGSIVYPKSGQPAYTGRFLVDAALKGSWEQPIKLVLTRATARVY